MFFSDESHYDYPAITFMYQLNVFISIRKRIDAGDGLLLIGLSKFAKSNRNRLESQMQT